MWCTKCGQQIKDHDKFCFKCGNPTGQYRKTISSPTQNHIQQPVMRQMNTGPVYQTPPIPVKRKKKRGLKTLKFIIGIVFVFVLIIGLVGVNDWLKDTRDRANGVSDNTKPIDSIKYGVNEDIQLTSYGPTSGTFGTIVTVEGKYLDRNVLEKTTINGMELNFRELASDYIKLIVPYGCSSGMIELHYSNETIEVGKFEIEAVEEVTITKQNIVPTNSVQVIGNNGVQITIPKKTLDKEELLQIKEVTNMQLTDVPFEIRSKVYDISIGDRHQFENYLTIEFDIPDDINGQPIAFYYNEDGNVWVPIASKINEKNNLEVRTDHLTLFAWGSFSESVMSQNQNFFVMYDSNDYHAGKLNTVREIAEKVGSICEAAKSSYEQQLPKSYHRIFSSFGFHAPMIVYVHSDYTGSPHYNPMSQTINVSTFFDDFNHLEQIVSHELFHSYQNVKWSAIKPYGKMGRSENLWGVEALAELAAYRLAYPNKYGIRNVEMSNKSTDQTTSMQPLNLKNSVHEYDMACFLDYLLKKSETDFVDLWINVGGSTRGNIDSMFYEYFSPKIYGFTTLESAHRDFWRSVLTNSETALFEIPEYIVDPILLDLDTGNISLSYESNYPFTQTFYSLKANRFDPLSPIRTLCITYDGDEDSSAYTTTIPGATGPSDMNKFRVPGGAPWKRIGKNAATGEMDYQIYRLTPEEKLLLVSLDQVGKKSGVKVSEIQVNCHPMSIDQLVLGTEYPIILEFKNIFPHIQNVITEVDYGDGSVDSFENYLLEEDLHLETSHVFDKPTERAITVSLFDVTNGEKELVAERQIPLGELVEFELYASPNNVVVGESIRLEVHPMKSDYNYVWDLGDGTVSDATEGLSAIDYTYDREGNFIPEVTVYDSDGNKLGSASVKVYIDSVEEITEPKTELEDEIQTQGEPIPAGFEWVYGTWMYNNPSNDMTTYITLKPNGRCTILLGDGYTEESTYDTWPSEVIPSELMIDVYSDIVNGRSYKTFITNYPNLELGFRPDVFVKVE